MNAPIKILHIFGRMQRGGAEMRTLELMRYIDRERYQFHFCALSGLPGTLDDDIRALGGEVHLMPLNLAFASRFKRLLQRGQFNIVHSHVHYFSGYILRLAAQAGISGRITHFRTTDDDHVSTLPRRLQRAIMRHWMNCYSTQFLAVSKGSMTSSLCTDWSSKRHCEVIYNGLDLQRFAGPADAAGVRREFEIPQAGKLFIHVGRMDPQKNHQRLISIFASVLGQDPSAYLLIVGRGGNEIEAALRVAVVSHAIADHVRFVGERSDVPRLLKAAGLMIFPSIWEGLPGAVLEAAAAGTPVLASDLSGVIEIASYLPLVHYLPLADNDNAWATKAQALYSSTRSAAVCELASAAFAASPFTVEQSARLHSKVWDKVGHVEGQYHD